MNIRFIKSFKRSSVRIKTSHAHSRCSRKFLSPMNNEIIFRREIRESLKKDVMKLGKKLPGFRPGLAIVQVGGREDSNVYIRMKLKAATEIGIHAEHVLLPKSITEGELLTKVRKLHKHFITNEKLRKSLF